MIVSNSTLSLALAAPMSLRHPNPNLLHRSPTISAYQRPGSQMVAELSVPNLSFECEGIKDRIRKAFDKIELSVSSYDTAWVAMVPSLDSLETPCFPECVTWLLDNQLPDGSWGLPHHDPLLTKDVLLSTLASVLALKRWGVGQEQMNKGLRFIELNYAYVSDEKQHTPIGFDIIFPGMIERAIDLDLSLPLSSAETHAMLQRRDMELKRSNSAGGKEYLAYVSEGLGKLQDWETTMKYQRKNGSLFNSPSTTAAALTNLKDGGCLRYIRSLLQKFGHAVPTSYPLDIYARLCMVENLERLGIERHFRDEIRRVLDETYRCWLQGEEEIFLDTTTFAMAFRILRANGYDVSSDILSQFVEEGHFFNSLSGYLKDKGAALELYKASEMIIHPDEVFLDRNRMWISNFLKQESSNGLMMADRLGKQISLEINNAIEFPHYAALERLGNRRAVEHFNVDDTRVLKTSYRSYNVGNEDFLKLAVEDFNMCQSIHQKELKCLERWIVDNRLDKLNFARQKLAYCYFSAGATLFSPKLSDARISWAKNGVLTTVVDDFFDVGGSEEELVNLIQLVEKWDVNLNEECFSEQVEIVFLALRSTIHELGEKAYAWQGRSVTGHIIEIWLNLMKSMLRENEWSRNKSVPTIDEYMTNAYVSFALGPIVLPALYFVGPQLSKEVVESPEYHDLYELMSTCGRYLNDIRGYKRESAEGKLNAVSLHMIHDGVTEEEAVKDIKTRIDSKRRELLQLVVQEKGSVVPRACKDLFWKMCKVVHLFYAKDDGFTAHDMYAAVNAVISEPLVLNKTS